ncbi:MAG: hypothetical protein SWN98_16780, partial [Pseudomonadota bacterium]|nr:hypothetical protein [Pseudomonadota bacterium]
LIADRDDNVKARFIHRAENGEVYRPGWSRVITPRPANRTSSPCIIFQAHPEKRGNFQHCLRSGRLSCSFSEVFTISPSFPPVPLLKMAAVYGNDAEQFGTTAFRIPASKRAMTLIHPVIWPEDGLFVCGVRLGRKCAAKRPGHSGKIERSGDRHRRRPRGDAGGQ